MFDTSSAPFMEGFSNDEIHEKIDQAVIDQTDGATPVNVIVAKDRRTLTPLNHFVAMFYDNMDAILRDYKMTPRTLRVLLHLLKQAEFGNLVLYAPKDIGKALDMDKSAVSRSLSALRKCGILVRPEGGGDFLNPHVFTKGRMTKVAANQPLMAAAWAAAKSRNWSPSFAPPVPPDAKNC